MEADLHRSSKSRKRLCTQTGSTGTLEVDRRFAAKDAGTDGASEIVVGLEPGLHLIRATGTEVFAGGIQPFAQALGKRLGVPPRCLESLLLSETVRIDDGLILKIVGYRPVDLGQGKRLELSQDRLGRQSVIEALDDGVKRHTRSGHVQARRCAPRRILSP